MGLQVYPKLFQYGDFFLPTYGVLVALAFLAGLWVTLRLARRTGVNSEVVANLAVYSALSGMLGAKLLMIVFDWDHYSANPGDIFFRHLTGGRRLSRRPGSRDSDRIRVPPIPEMAWLPTFDMFAPGVALGHAIGRLGCFAAGCCWGKETDFPGRSRFAIPMRRADRRALASRSATVAVVRIRERTDSFRIPVVAVR